jgi:tetratricopeptide (TPR) repeat protein
MRTWMQTTTAYAEAEALLQESLALAREIGDEATVALSARGLALVLTNMERYQEATALGQTSQALYEQTGDRRHVAEALLTLGRVALRQGDPDQAERYLRDAIAIPEADRVIVASGLHNLAVLAFKRRKFEEAHTYLQRVKEIGEEIGSPLATAPALYVLGIIAAREGRLSEARFYFEQCTAICTDTGDLPSIARGQARLGYVLARQGEWQAAWDQLARAFRFCQTGDHLAQTKDTMSSLGQASVHAGHSQRGAELLGLASRLPPGWVDLDVYELWVEPEMDLLRETLGAAELEAALARGAALDVDEVVAEVLACETPEVYWSVAPQADERS